MSTRRDAANPASRRTEIGAAVGAAAVARCVLLAGAVLALAQPILQGQIPSSRIVYSRGQTVAPAYEGWEPNPDGSFNLVFGYMNRNLDERLDIPVGPDNRIEPGGPDRGQPTHFLPRRNRFAFSVRVPADFGDQELVWSLTSRGRTEHAFATLRPEYVLDGIIIMRDTGFFGQWGDGRNNQPPAVAIAGKTHHTVAVGAPLKLVAVASDDGYPQPRPAPLELPARSTAVGLRVAWFVYRGPGEQVTFEPQQFKTYPDYRFGSPWTPGWSPPPVPADGRYPVTATFDTPGEYMLRVMAHDGGFHATADVAVTVRAQ